MRQVATFGKRAAFSPLKASATLGVSRSPAPTASVRSVASDQAVAQFIGPNVHKFIGVMKRMRDKDASYRKGVVSWCWPAFWLGPVWMLYRKMWVAAAAFFILNLVLTYLFKNSSGLLFNLIMGMWGKALYVGHAARAVEEIEANAVTPMDRINDMSRLGGVSSAAAWTAVGLTFVAGVVIAMVAMKSGQVPISRAI
jgi:hypothetical protein